jgi:hypothetical protein
MNALASNGQACGAVSTRASRLARRLHRELGQRGAARDALHRHRSHAQQGVVQLVRTGCGAHLERHHHRSVQRVVQQRGALHRAL